MFPGPDPRNSIQKLLQQFAPANRALGLGPTVPGPIQHQPPQSNLVANVGQDFRTKRLQFNPDPPNPNVALGVQKQYWNDATELAERSILGSQSTSHPLINQELYKLINPWGYGAASKLRQAFTERSQDHPTSPRTRNDAWRMYLGLPQEHGTFAISPYRPSRETDSNSTYYKLNNFWQAAAGPFQYSELDDPWSVPVATPPSKYDADAIQWLTDQLQNIQSVDSSKAVMGQYKLGQGQDKQGPYFSYYDKWDLGEDPIEGEKGRFGKPFEIYDRLYYDPVKRTINWPK